MNDHKKSYFAVIPATVRYDERLPANAKLLFGEITALCNAEGYCWATNQYFADLYGVSIVTISRWINALAKKGYITSQILYKDGTKEIDGRYIQICYEGINKNEGRYPQNCYEGLIKNVNTPINKNVKDNNTYMNNTMNNTSEYIYSADKPPRNRFTPPTLEEVQAYCIERKNNVDAERFIDYYTSNGWMVGKSKMKDWKAAVRTWEKNGYNAKRTNTDEAMDFYELGMQMEGGMPI